MNIGDERLARLVHFANSDPTNVALVCDAFDRAMALKDLNTAKQVIDSAISHNGEDAAFVYRQGALSLAMDDPRMARLIFESLPAFAQGDKNLRYMVALAHFCDNEAEQALAITQALLVEPECPAPALALALRAAHGLDRFEVARTLMQTHSNMLEFDADAMSTASLIYFDLGDVGTAQSLSAQALVIDGTLLEALVAHGSIKLLLDDVPQARSLLERALAVRNNTGRAWSALGLVSFREGKLDEAMEQLTRATQTMGQHIGTWHAMAWCCIVQRRLDEARGYLETALVLDRNFAETHGGLAVIHAIASEPSQAKACINRALRLDEACVSAKFAQALISGEVGDRESLDRFARKLLIANRRRAIDQGGAGAAPTLH